MKEKEKEKDKAAVTPVPSNPSSSTLLSSFSGSSTPSVPLSSLIQLIGDVHALTQGEQKSEAPLELLAAHIAQRFNQGLDVNALDSSSVSVASSSPSIPQLVRSALNVCGDKLSQTLPVLFGLCASRIVAQTSSVLSQGECGSLLA